jgi:hypothetical protein
VEKKLRGRFGRMKILLTFALAKTKREYRIDFGKFFELIDISKRSIEYVERHRRDAHSE